jgi:DNA helicase-2/ATP-dependent DNA helicase PcrA
MDKPTICVLARTNRALLPIGAALAEQNIPHHYIGKSGFFSQPEVKSCLSYLGCVLYPADWLILGALHSPYWPTKFLPKSALLAEMKSRHTEDFGYWKMLVEIPDSLVNIKNLPALRDFVSFVHSLSRYRSLDAAEALKSVISALRAVEYYSVEEDHSGDNDPVGNLVELVKLAGKHGSIKDFLDYTRRASAASKSKKGVMLSTIHSFKGMEADVVHVVQVSEGILPHAKATDLDEERNIWFTGASRARQRLVVTYSGAPSVFLKSVSEK